MNAVSAPVATKLPVNTCHTFMAVTADVACSPAKKLPLVSVGPQVTSGKVPVPDSNEKEKA